MKPWKRLAAAAAPDGGEFALWQRDAEFVVRVNGAELMSSHRHGSEEAMAAAVESTIARRQARVLIGGLGFGFTLRATLDRLAEGGRVEVVEISRDIVAWNRRWLGHLNGLAVEDARVTLTLGDFRQVIARAAVAGAKTGGAGGAGGGDGGPYDVILADVDNGPWPLAAKANRLLWQPAGMTAASRILRPGGVLVVWSTGPDPGFAERLRKAGFVVDIRPVRAHGRSGVRHCLFVAQWRGPS